MLNKELESLSTLGYVIEILRDTELRVADSYLVRTGKSSLKSGLFAGLEYFYLRVTFGKVEFEGRIYCGNSLLDSHPDFGDLVEECSNYLLRLTSGGSYLSLQGDEVLMISK